MKNAVDFENQQVSSVPSDYFSLFQNLISISDQKTNDLMGKLKANEHEYKNHLNTIWSIAQVTAPEEIKEKLNRSPDIADALALTFARPVALKGSGRRGLRGLMCNTDYCLMDVC